MSRLNVILVFIAFGLGTMGLFQNCSDMKASDPLNSGLETIETPGQREVPAFLSNREIPLDNKILVGSTSFSLGGDDVISYETDYLATYESTLLTIKGENGLAVVEVVTDDCTAKRSLTPEEENTFFTLFSDSFSNSEEKVPQNGEMQTQGCGFPRLVLDAAGANADVEIYYSSRECTPSNELFIGAASTIAPEVLLNDVQTYFRGQIDSLCSNP